MKKEALQILNQGSEEDKRALFAFDSNTRNDLILKKFRIWSKHFFPEYFMDGDEPVEDAPFHKTMDQGNLMVYRGRERYFLNIAGRGLAKTARTKLFIGFVIANDKEHRRKYFKILSKDLKNAKQSSTDIYNMLVSSRVKALYPEIFKKTSLKREETMSSFTTATKIKVVADSIGTGQRGDIQDESRPDFIWMDDIEDRLSLMSAALTHKVWANMEEARTGLAKDGGAVYTANYISERGNVHKLAKKLSHQLITPIATKSEQGWEPTWDRFSKKEVERIKEEADDFEGEYLCEPSASMDVYFDRESVDRQEPKNPIETVAGLKIYKEFKPSHRTAGAADVGGGVGLDHSTSCFIDFDYNPIQVVATYKNNEIKPDEFGYEFARHGKKFGECLLAPEKNYGSTLDILKTVYPTDKIYKTRKFTHKIEPPDPNEFGWHTNRDTKIRMLIDLAQAIERGEIELNDPDLIQEAREYTRDDLMDKDIDPRLTTRHFDLLIACAIAYQMQPFVKRPETKREDDYWLPSNPRLKVLGRNKKNKDDNPVR